jgi:mitochondrial fission process protein 1
MAKDPLDDIPHERKEPRPDFSKPLPRKPLPKELQETLNDEQKLWEALNDDSSYVERMRYGDLKLIPSVRSIDSTDTSVRYAAYAARARTILLAAHRYVAYTSDIGESFRPVAHPWFVRGAYTVSWLYIGGDVAYEGYKTYQKNLLVRNPQLAIEKHGLQGSKDPSIQHLQPGKVAPIDDYRTVMVQRGIFQSIASMGLPAFTIHSVVKYSGKAMKNVKNVTLRTWGPIGVIIAFTLPCKYGLICDQLGLAVVPALPYLFDKPVEQAVEWTFHKGFELVGGPEAVSGHKPELGLAQMVKAEKAKAKEKEL